MTTPKRLLHLFRKWKNLATRGRRSSSRITSSASDTAPKARKGHFIVYTTDGYRYELPLTYLDSSVLRALFETSEELFGLDGSEHITLPCDAAFMEFTVAFLKNRLPTDVEEALLSSIASLSGDKCFSAFFRSCDGEKNRLELLSGI